MTAGTRAFDGEEALSGADLAHAAAMRAGLGLGAGLGAGTRAALTHHRCWQADLRSLAVEGVLERDLHVVTQIGAALAAAAAAAPPHAEEIVEDVVEGRGEVAAEALLGAGAIAVLEGSMPEAVVGSTPVGIL